MAGIRTFTVQTNPENIVRGLAGDIFYRTGSLMYLMTNNGSTQNRLDYSIDNFLTKYKNPFYRNSLIQLQSDEESWQKISGTEASGWKFIGSMNLYVSIPPTSSIDPSALTDEFGVPITDESDVPLTS